MRPRSLEEFVGQQHFLGEGKLLRRAIEAHALQHTPPALGDATCPRAIAPGLGWRHASPTLLGPSADAELTPEVRLHIGRAPLGWWAEARMSSVRGSSLKVHAKTDVRELLSALGAKLRAAAHAEERTADFKGAEGGIEGSKAERDAWRVALDVLQDRAVRP